MTARTTGTRRGAHRSKRTVAGALLPSFLAVVAVTALVTALYVWRAEEPPTGASASTSRSTSEAIRSPEAPSPTATASPTSSRAAPATATTSKPPKKRTPRPASSSARAGSELVGSVEVVVLNQTRRAGLAARVADSLRSKGWAVPATGNFRGVVPATTVYYPPGDEAAALAAARALPTAPRIKPRFGNLSTNRLTVVVTDSYPS